ncbi:ATPase BadF/BadG/BcrA/BcrD type [Catenulispora acidiphila DSM 44928]|uniref:ATPase BadF/BadG/BcrA/BcrD type n=1 Tax=Catenulispora acidiphila (strain DSM 44928 / JCM 14897 / NBRC 102108 / NRRL B-24433 / ID139908) TaxID=479433 RepID=C7Q868_CATAD|nr:BadF/BadG/BcrA/BcrD ATPase family protein [Catenulispora acidiphila]ACU74235.1 ATPase BadF/BadG/BcrA/BcrD type [Catenulispora acidiphila DSM 44928]
MADPCVVGLDVGGSQSRAVLATAGGRTLGTGRAGGGNPTVLGAEAAVANIVAALKGALGEVPGERVEACVVGLAGVSTLMADPKAPHVLERAWADAGLVCRVRIVSDVTVSFAAGTPSPDGALLVSGTGAVAARMHDRLPARFRDGYGWLLGDEGSGFWIGRQAARAAIAAADGRRPMAALATAVLARLVDQDSVYREPAHQDPADQDSESIMTPDLPAGTTPDRSAGPDPRSRANATHPANPTDPINPTDPTDATTHATPTAAHPSARVRPAATGTLPLAASIGEGFTLRGRRRAAELVRAVAAQPAALASLAPLVMSAYELGDPAAVRIVAEAAEALVESLAGVAPAPGEPVVLGGSVLASRSPVFRAVAAAVGRRWPDSPVGLAADGAAGAAWLAARQLLGGERAAAGHAVFIGENHEFAEFS